MENRSRGLQDHRATIQGECGVFTLSPLTTAGLQARNFTLSTWGGEDLRTPAFYSENSLADEFSALCDPAIAVTNERVLNLVIKYFCVYIDDSLYAKPLSFSHVATFFECFGRHQSLNEPYDNVEEMNRMRQLSSVLRILADVPRMAHVFRDVVHMPIALNASERFVGLDMGTASGLLLVAMAINARRYGCKKLLIRGFMNDPVAGERTYDLLRRLGVGDLLQVPFINMRAFHWMQGHPPTIVVNESVSAVQQPLGEASFFAPYAALMATSKEFIEKTSFYPEGIVGYCREANVSMLIHSEMGFQIPEEYREKGLAAQAFLHCGSMVPTHRMGSDFYSYVSGPSFGEKK